MLSIFLNLLESILFNLILFFIFYFLNKIVLKISKKKILIGYYLFIFIIIILTSIRLNVGSDFKTYVSISNFVRSSYFTNIIEIIEFYNIQCGFPILCKLSEFFSKNPYSFLWITSIIIYILNFLYIHKHLKNPNERFFAYITFVVIGFFSVSLNILKQSIAMSIMFFAYDALSEKKYLKFIIYSLLSTIFHISALVAIFLYIISQRIRFNKKNLYLSVLFGIFLNISYKYFIVAVVNNISIFSRYNKYLIDSENLDRVWRPVAVLSYAILFFLLLRLILTEKNFESRRPNLLSLIMLGIPISILSIDNWVINRIALYCYQFIIIIFPIYIKRNIHKMKIVGIITILFLWYCQFNIIGGNNNTHSFDTYLFDD